MVSVERFPFSFRCKSTFSHTFKAFPESRFQILFLIIQVVLQYPRGVCCMDPLWILKTADNRIHGFGTFKSSEAVLQLECFPMHLGGLWSPQNLCVAVQALCKLQYAWFGQKEKKKEKHNFQFDYLMPFKAFWGPETVSPGLGRHWFFFAHKNNFESCRGGRRMHGPQQDSESLPDTNRA